MTKPKIIDGQRALDVETLSIRWRVSESTVKRYLRAGKLFGKKVYHGQWLVPAASIINFEGQFGFGPKPHSNDPLLTYLDEAEKVLKENLQSFDEKKRGEVAERKARDERKIELEKQREAEKKKAAEQVRTLKGFKRVRSTSPTDG